jgi:hypothetical protein
MQLTSRTYYRNLQSVFPNNSARQIHAHVVQIAVLYEDLRIELFALRKRSIKTFDQIDKYRPIYFLRRSIATLKEFAEASRLLDASDDFQWLKSTFDEQSKTRWEKAIGFFREQEKMIGDIRNDLGGHFGFPAALYAVANLRPNVSGKIEFVFKRPNKITPRLHFAGEIAATALSKRLPGSDNKAQLALFFKEILVPGYRHATNLIDPIVNHLLIPRFRE